MKFIAVLLLLVFPLFTQADHIPLLQNDSMVLNPPIRSFRWTPSIAKDYATQVAQEAGMTAPQVQRFVMTMNCESAGFKDPAIQSNYKRPDGSRELSFGYGQIFLPAHPDITLAQAVDPVFNISWSAKEFKTNPNQWSCFSKGLYKKFI